MKRNLCGAVIDLQYQVMKKNGKAQKVEERLMGAVPHVLVNDPTKGYGIFIENMLGAAA